MESWARKKSLQESGLAFGGDSGNLDGGRLPELPPWIVDLDAGVGIEGLRRRP